MHSSHTRETSEPRKKIDPQRFASSRSTLELNRYHTTKAQGNAPARTKMTPTKFLIAIFALVALLVVREISAGPCNSKLRQCTMHRVVEEHCAECCNLYELDYSFSKDFSCWCIRRCPLKKKKNKSSKNDASSATKTSSGETATK